MPKNTPIVQFHAKCSAVGNHKLRVLRYAIESQTPASAVFKVEKRVRFGFPKCAHPKKIEKSRIGTTAGAPRRSVWNAYPLKISSSKAAARINNTSEDAISAATVRAPAQLIPPCSRCNIGLKLSREPPPATCNATTDAIITPLITQPFKMSPNQLPCNAKPSAESFILSRNLRQIHETGATHATITA